MRRKFGLTWRRRYTTAGFLALVGVMTFFVAGAFADAGNPILFTIKGDIVPDNPANPNGPVTVFVRGQWNWISHNADCNETVTAGTDRAGTGVGMVWNDPNGRSGTDAFNGYKYTAKGITVYLGVKNAGFGNAVDGLVHPVDRGNRPENYDRAGLDYPSGQAFNDPAPVASGSLTDAQANAWKAGCGRIPLSATAGPRTGSGANAESTNSSCGTTPASTTCNGHPWGSWGYEKTGGAKLGYSHHYASRADVTSVCANFYDVHGKLQVPEKPEKIDVLGNGDNSVNTNSFNVNDGANCIFFPLITTSATSSITIGASISDSATLSGAQPNAAGKIVFVAYEPNLANTCTTAEFTSAAISAPTNGTYGPSAATTFTPTKVGDYHWRAFYGTAATAAGVIASPIVSTPCGDTGETSTVGKASPQVTTTSTVTASLNQQASVNINDVAHVVQPANTINTTGAITFDVFGPFTGATTSASCTLAKQVASGLNATPATNGTGDYTSANYAATAPGTYLWIAHLAQDSNNNADDTVCNEAGESSLVINPSIDVSKTPARQSVPLNGLAHFTILVTNNGDARLTGIVIGDLLSPNCARNATQTAAASVAKYGAGHTFLDPGEFFSYTCDSPPVTAPFVNVVTACGNDPLGNTVCDTDTNGGTPPADCPASEADRCAGVSISSLSSKQDFKPKDTGTLAGLANTPNGTLTFSLFKGACTAANQLDLNGTGTAGKDLTAAVNANGDYTVTATDFLSDMLGSPNTNGTFNWQLSYTGDTHSNADILGACGTENFVVTNG